jgi:hypothetical protein
MKDKIVSLKCTCGGAPFQYEGFLETGESIYARERGGYCRVEKDGDIIYSTTNDEMSGEDPLAVLYNLFDITCEIE